MSDREVKTRQTCREWIKSIRSDDESLNREREYAWTAALASVIPEGKRFEVGDRATCAGVPGRIGFKPDDERTSWWSFDPRAVEMAPRTVELTVNEKLRELATAMLNKIEPTTSDAVAHDLINIHIEISQSLANGKTLDQLCSEFGVSTTKEMS